MGNVLERLSPARFASVLLVLSVGFTAVFTRSFVKFRFGPLYLLELVFFIGLVCFLSRAKRIELGKIRGVALCLLAFGVWGFLRLLLDFTVFAAPTLVPIERTVQYAILFVYPVLWIFLGFLQNQVDDDYSNVIAGAALLTTIPNFWGARVIHLSFGPLMVVPLVYFSAKLLTKRFSLRENLNRILLTVGLFFLTFVPFWEMWLNYMQRTNFAMLAIAIVMLPFLIRTKNYSKQLAVSLVVLLFAGTILGGFAYYYFTRCEVESFFHRNANVIQMLRSGGAKLECSSTNLRFNSFIPSSFQKGEDDSEDLNAPVSIKLRSRMFMWENTWNHWKEKPVLGRGFRIDMPSFLRENYPNLPNSVVSGDGPVTGSHNSYLQILARMGIIGITLFLLFTVALFKNFAQYFLTQKETSFPDVLMFVLVFNGFLYAIVNVGFESPHVAFPIWLFAGILLSKGTRTSESISQN